MVTALAALAKAHYPSSKAAGFARSGYLECQHRRGDPEIV
jgi:hypothetical protein